MNPGEIKEKTVKELKEMVDNNDDFQLIDVREPHEKDIADIGGELIPLGDLVHQVEKIKKDKTVIIYCRSGQRSAAAVTELQNSHGFENLFNLKGSLWMRLSSLI